MIFCGNGLFFNNYWGVNSFGAEQTEYKQHVFLTEAVTRLNI